MTAISAWAATSSEDGIQKEFYPDGQLKSERPVVGGMIDGFFRQYYSDGALAKEVSYKHGVMQGLGKSYFDDGKLWSEGTFADGVGTVKIFRRDGSLEHEVSYQKGELAKTADYYEIILSKTTSFYRNGNPAQVCDYQNNGVDSDCRGFFEDGTPFYEGHERNLQADGLQTFFRPDGTLDYTVRYNAGLWDDKNQVVFPDPDGVRRLNYKSGKMAQEAYFKDGKRNGWTRYYYENGDLMSELSYRDGRVDGPYQAFDQDRQMTSKGSYREGNQDGEMWLGWQGQITERRLYKNGTLIRRMGPGGELPVPGQVATSKPD